MALKPLTAAQHRVFRFVGEMIVSRGYAPLLDEIAAHCDGIKRPSVYEHVDALVRKGYLRRMRRKARGLSLTRDAQQLFADRTCPYCGRSLVSASSADGPADISPGSGGTDAQSQYQDH